MVWVDAPCIFVRIDATAMRLRGTTMQWAKLCSLAAFVLALVFSADARADNALLQKIDSELNKWKTLDYSYKIVTTKDGDDDSSVLSLRMRMQYTGSHNKQLIEISEPADMKGTKVLTLAPTEMYIYLPAFKKIRRIASHVTEQGFLGTALSQRDLTLTRYADKYDASQKTEADGKITLTLKGKNDQAPYPKIVLVVDDKKLLPSSIKYFSDDDKHVKTETRTQYRCSKDYCTPGAMKIEDHAAGVKSILYLKDYTINPKLEDSLFSKRSLK